MASQRGINCARVSATKRKARRISTINCTMFSSIMTTSGQNTNTGIVMLTVPPEAEKATCEGQKSEKSDPEKATTADKFIVKQACRVPREVHVKRERPQTQNSDELIAMIEPKSLTNHTLNVELTTSN